MRIKALHAFFVLLTILLHQISHQTQLGLINAPYEPQPSLALYVRQIAPALLLQNDRFDPSEVLLFLKEHCEAYDGPIYQKTSDY